MDFVAVNEDIAVVETFSGEAMLAGNVEAVEDDNDENEQEPVQPMTFRQAKAALNDLRHFLAANVVGDDVFQALHTLDVAVDNIKNDNLIQKKITYFFA